MKKISAILITHNEEEKIERALRSLQSVSDEIIVVDSYSTDTTTKI
ncbi:MAG: glycosyltransferase [Acidobacteriota bacterium]